MEPTARNIATFMYPTAICSPNPPEPQDPPDPPWEESPLNPRTRINGLEMPDDSDWLIWGADPAGSRWFATPTFAVGKPPLRIDIYVPEYEEIPWQLRTVLSPNSPMFSDFRTAATSSMASFILQALSRWSRQTIQFQKQYYSLPFGSRIVFGNVRANLSEIGIHMIPAYDTERQWLSMKSLQDMWKHDIKVWPEVVDWQDLRFEEQIHDTVLVVTIAGDQGTKYVFKSLLDDLKYFYHELKVLLTMKPHPNVVAKPKFIVTKRCLWGGKLGVCGMILEYHPVGDLRRYLRQNLRLGQVRVIQQLTWAKQIISALIHVQKHGPGFYTNLKLENIVLAKSEESQELRVVLIDFEQRLGCPAYTPPEIHLMSFIADLAHQKHQSSFAQRYEDLLAKHSIQVVRPRKQQRYADAEHGRCFPWPNLSSADREAAQVFMVGKLLWCLFENATLLNGYISISSFRECGSTEIFPEFERTPVSLRDCIMNCTLGSWESRKCPPPHMVRGKKIVLRCDSKDGAEGTLDEIRIAIRRWWRQQIFEAEQFLERWATTGLSGYHRMRPRLRDVLRAVECAEESWNYASDR